MRKYYDDGEVVWRHEGNKQPSGEEAVTFPSSISLDSNNNVLVAGFESPDGDATEIYVQKLSP